jgi:TatD DNase family protein
MSITDTHTHLYASEFDEDRNAMIDRAIANGVTRFFIPAIDSQSTIAMYELEALYPKNIFLMMGLHPTYVNENFENELQHVENELKKRKFYAIGEIGIDLFWDKTFLEQQKLAFKHQIQLAKNHKLPIVIHCREAFDEIFEILKEEKSADLFGIFHCFTGNYDQALHAISLNMMLGIGGVVTFKNGKIDQFLAQIDLKHIVLETDSPYLAPIPFRGKRNESSYIVTIVSKLASIYGLSKEEIINQTTINSQLIFGI